MKRSYLVCYAATLALLGVARPVDASVLFNITESGSDVVVTGSGTLDTTDLTFVFNADFFPFMQPFGGILIVDNTNGETASIYTGVSGPTAFGPGTGVAPSGVLSGDFIGINGLDGVHGYIYVPVGYVSGSSLSAANTYYANSTLAGLGITPGIYTWTWGTGAHADSLTINAGSEPAPEPGTAVLLAAGCLGFALLRRRVRA